MKEVLIKLINFSMDPDNLEFEDSQAVAWGGFGEVWKARMRKPRRIHEFPDDEQSGMVAVKKGKLSEETAISKKASYRYNTKKWLRTKCTLALRKGGDDMVRCPPSEHFAILGLSR